MKRWGIPLLLSLAFHAAAGFLLFGDRCVAAPPPIVMKAHLVLLPQAAPSRPEKEDRTPEPASNLRPVRPVQPRSKPPQQPQKTAPSASAGHVPSFGNGFAETAIEGLPVLSADPVPSSSTEAHVPVLEAQEPDILARTKPLYPMSSRKKGESGTVVLLVRLDRQGHVLEISVRSSSGYPALDQSAARAVRSWKFRQDAPGLLLVPVVFQLE